MAALKSTWGCAYSPDLTGRIFKFFKVLGPAGKVGPRRAWRCWCICGSVVTRTGQALKVGAKSCGCRTPEPPRGKRRTHGMATTTEYESWRGMLNRCYLPTVKKYAAYGARGIRVCDRWKDSFENFYEDMGPKPGPEYSIDRIENDGDYGPENCRWALRETQANNTRRNRLISYRGKTQTIAQWCRETGLSYPALIQRIDAGWDVEKALTTPQMSPNGRR